jgi:cobalamin biosynthesis Mg chelatase CobN
VIRTVALLALCAAGLGACGSGSGKSAVTNLAQGTGTIAATAARTAPTHHTVTVAAAAQTHTVAAEPETQTVTTPGESSTVTTTHSQTVTAPPSTQTVAHTTTSTVTTTATTTVPVTATTTTSGHHGAAVAAGAVAAENSQSSSSSSLPTWAWVLIGVGLAGIAIGGVLYFENRKRTGKDKAGEAPDPDSA